MIDDSVSIFAENYPLPTKQTNKQNKKQQDVKYENKEIGG